MRWLAVLLGGAAGASARYGVTLAVGERSFPWAVLGINVVGAFLLGLLAAARVSDTTRVALGVGLLGGFTTFSTFSLDAWNLLRQDRAGAAAAYVAASCVLGVAAAAAGWTVAGR